MSFALLETALISVLPIAELRAGIPFALSTGVHPILAFLIATLANILIIPVIFLFLDYVHVYFMKVHFYNRFFQYYVTRLQRKLARRNVRKYTYLVLFSFVAIPMIGTGAYTGVLISWLLRLNRRYSYVVIALGVLVAGIIVTLASLGLFGLFA